MNFLQTAYEQWLLKGTRPWKIIPKLLSLVLAAVPLYGYFSHPGRPGAAWWLVVFLVLVVLFLGLDALRWRIRHNRIEKERYRHLDQTDQISRLKGELAASHLELSDRTKAFTDLKAFINEERVSDPHFAELKRLIDSAYSQVRGNKLVAFATTSDQDALFSHFPHLEADIDGWNYAIQHVHDTAKAVRLRLVEECDSRGIAEPTFNTPLIVNSMWSRILTRANNGNGMTELPWVGYPLWTRIQWAGTVGWIIDNTSKDERRPTDYLRRMLDILFEESRSWPETEAYISRDESSLWPQLQNPLLAELEGLAERDHFKKGNGCKRCR